MTKRFSALLSSAALEKFAPEAHQPSARKTADRSAENEPVITVSLSMIITLL